jgi:CBS domain-containing protein
MKRNVAISKIMTNAPATVHPKMSLSEAQNVLATGGFHHVPVVEGNKLVGMLTSTDLLRVTYEYGQDPRAAAAVLDHTHDITELMTKELTTIGPKQTVRQAFELLSDGSFHALPVVEDGDLVGIVTTTDLLRYTLDQY